MQSSLLFESLFKRKYTDSGNADYLKRLAEEHPYFSPAQFYLLQQKNSGAEDYTLQAAKTGILFNNPYWLNFQLLQVPQPVMEVVVANEEETFPIIENTFIPQEQPYQPIEQELPEIKATIFQQEPIAENKIIFEPLHITDYFASQGIKLSDEIQPTDKLGKQLKSFTDWLKTMKKISPERMQIDHNAQTDSSIQTLAEKSNAEGDVLTETMAEIFVQQGKTEKAIETYQKLSLLNPSKNAYFAAKIEQLNGH